MRPFSTPSRVIWLIVIIIGLAAAPTLAEERTYQEQEFSGGRLEYVNEVPVLYVSGTPGDMGAQSAALSTNRVKPLLTIPRKLLDDSGVGVAWPVIVKGAKHMFTAAPPRYREELDAAGKAVGLTDDELGSLYVANAMVELRRMGGCSGLLVMPERSANGEMIFGRNLDFPNIANLYQLGLVTVYRPQGRHAFASIGFPGMVGVISGMNDAGLCLATFDSYAAKDGSPMFNPQGVPLALLNRQILEECSTLDEARKLLEASKRTTMMSLVICDREHAAVFELTPKSVVQRNAEQDVLICTNHFISPQLHVVKDCWRFDKLLERRAQKGPLGMEQLAAALNDVNQGDFTLQTMTFEPAHLRIGVSLGPPPSSAHTLHTLEPFAEIATAATK